MAVDSGAENESDDNEAGYCDTDVHPSGYGSESDGGGLISEHFSEFDQHTFALFLSPQDIDVGKIHATLQRLPTIDVDLSAAVVPQPGGARSLFENSSYLFTPSEIMLYGLAKKRHWTEDELKSVINLVRDPAFLRRDIGPDLQRRVIFRIFFARNSHLCNAMLHVLYTKIMRKI